MFEIPILLIFFNRPEKFEKVFEVICELKPQILYLYQDGARINNKNDEINMKKCREIIEKGLNWSCEVHKKYQDKNYGCDPSGYIAHTWLFSNEEFGIVLEDDVVPDITFFEFCRQLLYKYKDDNRINMICGMNQFGKTNTDNSYVFSRYCSIWGWASWARVVNGWDPKYHFLEDKEKCLEIKKRFVNNKEYKNFLHACRRHKASGKEHFESILWSNSFLNDRYTIIPKVNLISNIGVGSETTHGTDDIRILPKKQQLLFNAPVYHMIFPLKHPNTIKLDKKFERGFYVSYFEKYFQKVEILYYRLKYKGFKDTCRKINEMILKRCGAKK